MNFFSWLKSLFIKPKDAPVLDLSAMNKTKIPAVKPTEPEKHTPGDDAVVAAAIQSVKKEEKKIIPPWFSKAKTYTGQVETNSKFNSFMSGFWKIVGLPNYKTIIGTSFAWCGLFVAASLNLVSLPWQKNGAGAKNWDAYGIAIDYKVNGIPQGAIVRINHNYDCDSGGGNHVSMADGDCTASDLLKPGATINLYGGNQLNAVKVTTYSVKEICSVRWPKDYEKPARVVKSVNCGGKTASGESTR